MIKDAINKKHKSVFRWYLNLGFRNKIISVCLVVGLLPVILLGIFSYRQTQQMLLERAEHELEDTLVRETQNIDYRLRQYLNALNIIAWNETLKEALLDSYDDTYDMYIVYRDVIEPLYNTVNLIHNEIKEVTIYSDTALNPHGRILQPLDKLDKLEWYGQLEISFLPQFYLSKDCKTLHLFCQIYNQGQPGTSYVCMQTDTHVLFDPLEKLDYRVTVLNYEGDIAYQNKKESENPAFEQALSDGPDAAKYLTMSRQLENSKGTLCFSIPRSEIFESARQIKQSTILMITICILLILSCSFLFAKLVVRPILELTANMKEIREDHLEVTVTTESTDEIGYLIQSFRRMVKRLQYLIDEVYKNQIAKQEYEMKALQAQINPHFFYNSLSTINTKALLCGQEEISRMALLLSKFYRTSLNGGRNVISLRDEMSNMRSYIDIMKILHDDDFEEVYDIDYSLEDCVIPNLLIQPLIENAILHGLEEQELNKRGIITVRIYAEEEDLIIKVMDNGCGMTKERCDSLLTNPTSGYGLKNVHQRVQLAYGEGYGLSFTSTLNLGTCATLRLRKTMGKK